MANVKNGSTAVAQRQAGDDTEDVPSGRAAAPTTSGPSVTPTAYAPPSRPGQTMAGQPATGEVAGDVTIPQTAVETVPETGTHEEVASGFGAEAGEEYAEATPAQLASAESGEESAVSDLRGVEGFEFQEAMEEGAATPTPTVLRDAGEAVQGAQEEFFPALAALAAPLISAVGPAVARGVTSILSPRAKTVIRRIAARPKPVIGAVTAAAAAARGKGGTSDLLALIAKLIQQAQAKPGGESGMESEEVRTLVEEAAAAIEVIIGTDDRVRITQTTQVPWRRLCALRITFPSGATYRGTGFLIGPRAVATAGHCVYLHNQGGWARRVEVIPGANGSIRPFGQAESATFRSVAGWVTSRKPESDYGCVVLPAGAFGGNNLGSFGFAAFDTAILLAQNAVLAGYPGDKPFAELWGMARRIKAVTAKTLIYDIDTMGGQSGAPVYIKRNGQRYVVGIHNYGAATGNSATRVTLPVYQRLLAWSKL